MRIVFVDVSAEKWPCSAQDRERVMERVAIQEEERVRIRKFRFEIDAKRSLAGRLLLRHLAAERLCVPSGSVRFERTPQGKPYLKLENKGTNERDFGFNINASHHGSFVVAASSESHIVGVDVMKYDPPRSGTIDEYFDLMSNCFTPAEWKHLNSPGSDREKLVRFYRYWCFKESYIKAVGIGLGLELQRMHFKFEDATPDEIDNGIVLRGVLELDGTRLSAWSFYLYEPDADHCLAVAYGPFADCHPDYAKCVDRFARAAPALKDACLVRAERILADDLVTSLCGAIVS